MMRLLAILLLAQVAFAADYPPLKFDHGTPSPLVQRTMKALATSTKEKPNTVRILFYGQSITEQKWTELVLKDLKARFPTANIQAENRALGGYASQMLVHTAETDLYPFQPDLLIFHVYGAHNTYEDIIRRTRERTSAEILMQTDHVTKSADFTEETDAKKLKPDGKIWDAFMNHKHLPEVAKKYQAAICDQRAMWKHYLKENKLEPKALLSDNVHLNAHGEFLMAECVKASLRYDPECKTIPAEGWRSIVDVEARKPIKFTGVAAELLTLSGITNADVMIDGFKPSDTLNCWGFTRALPKPGGKWPAVAGFVPAALPVEQTWTITLQPAKDKPKQYTFIVTSSTTGDEGSGSTDKQFTAKSKCFTIEPGQWNVDYSQMLSGLKPPLEKTVITFKSALLGKEQVRVSSLQANSLMDSRFILAQGLENTKHTLVLKGEISNSAQLLIHSPPPPPAK